MFLYFIGFISTVIPAVRYDMSYHILGNGASERQKQRGGGLHPATAKKRRLNVYIYIYIYIIFAEARRRKEIAPSIASCGVHASCQDLATERGHGFCGRKAEDHGGVVSAFLKRLAKYSNGYFDSRST